MGQAPWTGALGQIPFNRASPNAKESSGFSLGPTLVHRSDNAFA